MIRYISKCLVVVLLLCSCSSVWGRTWFATGVPGQQGWGLGSFPSLCLINGVQPVVSGGFDSPAFQQTPFGWMTCPGISGFLDGDGGTKIVSNNSPVRMGLDGRFYSTIPLSTGGGPVSTTLENGVWLPTGASVPSWGNNTFGISTADSNGRAYVAYGNYLGVSGGAFQQLPVWATDLAVSSFGDIAVSGYSMSGPILAVSWYDYGLGSWRSRNLAPMGSYLGRVGVEFDQKGNLGVAYVDTSYALHFAYLDMAQDLWTDEIVVGDVGGYQAGTALDFNAQDLPVIAAGCVLAYDPITVPEPASLLVFSALTWIFINRRKA